ncbi:MAG: pyrroloquinoline-quinone synthase PqqC [Bdellovibrionales bacterium]
MSLLSRAEFLQCLQACGDRNYHHRHPFHLLMHEGKLTKTQMQAWALNRYYYQSIIPQKDAIILSRSTDAEFRRAWRTRIEDHDGRQDGGPGGIEKWIRLAEATGVSREIVESCKMVLPGVRFAVDAYLELVTKRSFLEAVASSLTEMFSAQLIAVRIRHLNQLYPWMAHGLDYFQSRLGQAPEDAEFALDYVYSHAKSREQQELCIAALERKCQILWAQLDAISHAYVTPGEPPPGFAWNLGGAK